MKIEIDNKKNQLIESQDLLRLEMIQGSFVFENRLKGIHPDYRTYFVFLKDGVEELGKVKDLSSARECIALAGQLAIQIRLEQKPCPENINNESYQRALFIQCSFEALGLYMSKEPKIGDQWRQQNFYQVFMHGKHEIEEIARSKTADRQYHNCLDAMGQFAIVAAWVKLDKGD